MEKMTMHTPNLADENYRKLAALFPNAVTEAVDESGEVVRAIDKDVLMQEISVRVVEGREERYQFTWPDKKKAILAANAPIAATLRPVREDSVGKDGTPGAFDSENLYIEGDNLDVLKLLQETYLGKVKMIYIDPPYNTGNDFVYEDDFAEDAEAYLARSGQYDDQGNRLEQNMESNGRFHTDWLNMIYPRLKLAKNLLADDGVIFISIDYNENYNLRKVMDEIFGRANFVGEIYWESKTKSQNTRSAFNKLQPKAEMIFVYTKATKRRFNLIKVGEKEYPYLDDKGEYREALLEFMNAEGIRGRETMIFDITDGVSTVSPPVGKQWKLGQAQVATYQKNGELIIRDGKVYIKMRPEYERNETTEPFWGFFSKDMGTAESAKKELTALIDGHGFETVKPLEVIKRLAYHGTDKNDLIIDFFSGSSTTAHAVMQLNAEDSGHRKFIMVQIPEKTKEGSESFRAGFETICEIGKERIRRAARKIREEAGLALPQGFDGGFRCLRLDSSNMQDVYYNPSAMTQDLLALTTDNIKPDRTPEDLLFQVMLDLGIDLSSAIEETEIAGCKVFNVADGFLLACFDKGVDTSAVTGIAKKKPYYAVFRDSGMADDSTAANFDQIFRTYSPATVRKVL